VAPILAAQGAAVTGRFLIVGLGNPGRRYRDTRHNIGFQVADRLAARYGLRFSRRQAMAFVADGQIDGHLATLAKPQGYMNMSGRSVGALVRFYKTPLSNLLVMLDDLDLPVGALRMRPGGGSGGHHGLQDIIQHVGGQDFPRLRIGIGRPPGRMDPAAYVLQRFSAGQLSDIEDARERATGAVLVWLAEGLESAMTRYNRAYPVE
jgi:PTH1 family peptidyl-tRNA hydrolase